MARSKKYTTQSSQSFRDRIKELRRVKASELIPNPHNWHEHPIEQRQDMIGVLNEIGYADAMLARELPDGRLELLDGHLRSDIAEDDIVPVLILDLNEQEAKQLIAVHDMLGKKALTNDDVLGDLLRDMEVEDADMRRMLDEIRGDLDLQVPDDETAPAGDGPAAMELMPHEHYDYLIVLARTTREWNRLVELVGVKEVACPGHRKPKIGVGRGIKAAKLIALLEGNNGNETGGDTE
jgi:hypothetical protein